MIKRGGWILLAATLCAGYAHAQTRAQSSAGKAPAKAPAKVAAPVNRPVATVNGDVIGSIDFDALLRNYTAQTEAQNKGKKLSPADRVGLATNVLSGLINDRLWVQEAKRNGVTVPDSTVNNKIRQDPFFLAQDGKFDETKWQFFETGGQSNYPDVFRRARDILLVERLRAVLDRKYTPDEKKLFDEYLKRNQRHRIKFVWLRPDPSLLEGVVPRDTVAAYYKVHADDFQIKEKIDVLLPMYRVGTVHDTSWEQSRQHAEELLDKLRRGAALDSVTAAGAQRLTSGLTERGMTISLLKHGPSLTDSLFLLAPGQPHPAVVLGIDGYGVAVMNTRHPSSIRPLQEVYPAAYRGAFSEWKKSRDRDLARKYYLENPSLFRTRAVNATLLFFDRRAFHRDTPPSASELEKFYELRKPLYTRLDTVSGKPVPRPLEEIRPTLLKDFPDWYANEQYVAAWRGALASAQRNGDVFREPPAGARVMNMPGVCADSRDSVFTQEAPRDLALANPGSVGALVAAVPGQLVYRINSRDTAYLPPFDVVEGRAVQAIMEARKGAREGAAQLYYTRHRDQFKGGKQYVLNYLSMTFPDASELTIKPSDEEKYYQDHIQEFSSDERVHLAGIVLNLRPNAPPAEARVTLARAESLLVRARRGEDFSELASKNSEDPNSARVGGDLGYLNRFTLRDTAVARVAFGMHNGEFAGPVRGSRGYYVLHCLSNEPSKPTPFAEVKDKVYRAIAHIKGDELGRSRAAEIQARCHNLSDLVAEAEKLKTGLNKTLPFELGDDLPGLSDFADLATVLPTLKIGQFSPKPSRFIGGFLIWNLDTILSEAPRSYDRARPEVLARMDKDSMVALLRRQADTLEARTKVSDNLPDIAYDLGAVRESGPFVRNSFISGLGSASIVDTFLVSAKPGQISWPIAHPNDGWVLAQYLGMDPLDSKEYERTKSQLKDELVEGPERNLLVELRRRAKVKIFRKDLAAAWKPELN